MPEERSAITRLRFVSGNYFEQPLPPADVILMGHILHDWGIDDTTAVHSSFTKPSSTTTVRKRVRPDDEPQHVD
jgi:hypothetical protein